MVKDEGLFTCDPALTWIVTNTICIPITRDSANTIETSKYLILFDILHHLVDYVGFPELCPGNWRAISSRYFGYGGGRMFIDA
jgi:hypothetical protein